MPQPGIYMLYLDSFTMQEPFRQARSANALVSILSARATCKFVSKRERAPHFQLCQGHKPFVFIPCNFEVQSVCVVGDREMCVYVWVNGGRKGQTRPRKGAWDPGRRDRGRDSEKRGEEQKMEMWMERCSLGLGDWVKAQTGSHLCQLGWRDNAHSLSCAGTFHCTSLPRNYPFTYTMRSKPMAEWMTAQGKGTVCICLNEIHDFVSNSNFFSVGGGKLEAIEHQNL